MRSAIVLVMVVAGYGCDGSFDEGDVTLSMSTDGRLLAGVFACGSTTVAAPEQAFLYELTGNRETPEVLLWHGRYAGTADELKLADIDVFALYEAVEGAGPVASADDLAQLGDSTVVSLVLEGHGGYFAPLGLLRAHPGAYLDEGRTGTFEARRAEFCGS